ncbi:hypothetical protein BJV82DRAFT_606692 [Fennellomyces sp. T-0311]|nr:hypothetical protein BJV82DRAFT_606692 [Fennellomyces sp. T-0311]
MRLATLNEELESITRDYDYGIVPGSATIFVLDEIEALGRLDLTLLEGVMIVVEVNSQGYKITSHSPLYSGAAALATTQAILAHINQPFETMENLLMTVSPMFCQRFQEVLYQKLQSVHQQQMPEEQQQPPFPNNSSSYASSAPSTSSNPSLHNSASRNPATADPPENWIR